MTCGIPYSSEASEETRAAEPPFPAPPCGDDCTGVCIKPVIRESRLSYILSGNDRPLGLQVNFTRHRYLYFLEYLQNRNHKVRGVIHRGLRLLPARSADPAVAINNGLLFQMGITDDGTNLYVLCAPNCQGVGHPHRRTPPTSPQPSPPASHKRARTSESPPASPKQARTSEPANPPPCSACGRS